MTRSVPPRTVTTILRCCGWRGRRRDETGATLVEFAIILPVFALMLFGMIQFGLAFMGWDQLRNAVDTAARIAANDNTTSPGANCAQPATDPDGNMVCQIAFLIGSPVDTSPSPVTSPITIEPPGQSVYGCNPPLKHCQSDAWLDGYYIFDNGQWLQIVNSNPSPGEVTDQQAFDDGRGTWICVTRSGPNCIAMSTNVAGQNSAALGSDNVAIRIASNDVSEVCAQRQVISFTAFPALQDLHMSSTSTFYLPSTSVLQCPSSSPCTYPSDPTGNSTCG
jgi:Flp pilus assembly pilin Flp